MVTASVIVVGRTQSPFQLEKTLKITAFIFHRFLDGLSKAHSLLPIINSVSKRPYRIAVLLYPILQAMSAVNRPYSRAQIN